MPFLSSKASVFKSIISQMDDRLRAATEKPSNEN